MFSVISITKSVHYYNITLFMKNIFVCVLKYDAYYIPTVFVPSDTINAARIEPVSNPALLTKV